MKYVVVIPAHNEEAFLGITLDSLLKQSITPEQILVVNDNSTDATAEIIDNYASRSHGLITRIDRRSENTHMPGSKVVRTFNAGLQRISEPWDVIVKLDADLILPENYFEEILRVFSEEPGTGIAGGFVLEQNSTGEWKVNHPMHKDHVRGAFKAYSRSCFTAIGGLRAAMGWDTADELLARYHGFEIVTLEHLLVKHLRPTGKAYNKKAKQLQGQAMYLMRYSTPLALIASIKMALKQNNPKVVLHNMQGFFNARKAQMPPVVTPEEGRFIRNFRWKGIRSRLNL